MSSEEKNKIKKGFSRRKFLTRGAVILGSTYAVFHFGCTPIRRGMANYVAGIDFSSGIKDFSPNFWFEVLEDNTILMKCPKVEMGQGVFTGLAMLAAEELEIPLSQIKVMPGSTKNSAKDNLGTGGSSSTAALYTPIREVAASMREMLKAAVAKIWNMPIGAIIANEGRFSADNKTMTYAEVVQQTTEWEVPKKAPALKPKSNFKYVGKDVKRVDLKAKVMGESIFAMDAELPDMVYAVTLECPYIEGTLKSLDTMAAKQLSGVIKVIQEEGLVAVVAKNRFAAEMGKRQLKAAWDVPKIWQQADIDKLVTVGHSTPVNIAKEGNVYAVFKENPDAVFQSEYRTPTGVHAQLEPNGAVAKVTKDNALVIVGTQDTNRLLGKLADAIGLKKDNIEVRNAFLGGGFGRRYFEYEAVEAAKISKIMGKPVQLFKDREEEFMNGYYRPAAHHIMKAKITNGKIEAFEHLVAAGSMILSELPAIAHKLLGADFMSTGHGAEIIYHIPHHSTTVYDAKMPFRTGLWRGVGAFLNAFPIEGFMDELARKIGKDPIELRLEYLKEEDPILRRLKQTITTVREKSGWNTPKPPGVGRGFACFKDRKTVVAAVAEVKIENGKIKVTKMTNVIDAGLIINPEGVRTQVEGCVMMGISATLYEDIQIKDGKFTATNYHQYPMATLIDTPEIEVIMLEGADEPYGVGEPPIVTIPPAIANAVFDLTGQRLRNLPLKIKH